MATVKEINEAVTEIIQWQYEYKLTEEVAKAKYTIRKEDEFE